MSGYLVRARYVSIHDVFQGLPSRTREGEATTLSVARALFLLLFSFAFVILPRARLRARVRRVYRMSYRPAVPSMVSGSPHARFTVN